MKTLATAIIVLLMAAAPASAWAKNIDLSTVPARDTVQLTIYNAEDLTLVRETRRITFKQGVNPLQFSWAGTLIDPTSVELRFLSDPEKLSVLDTTFPHDKPQMLYWNVASDFDGEATVEISYFTSGITWSADYVGITSADEKTMKLDGYVTVTNRSGEDYQNASVRLVVGTINLVEQIAMLAQQGVVTKGAGARGQVMRRAVQKAESEAMFSLRADALAAPLPGAKQIVKEGLSEYFIFAIEGQETVPDDWSKRLRSFQADAAPVKVEYRYRPEEYGDQLMRLYLLTNDKESDMGTAPLPDGIVRIFKQKGDAGLAYVTQQAIKYIPIGDKIELQVGVDPNVVFELKTLAATRDNIWGTFGSKIRRRMDEPGVRIEDRGVVEGWDEHEVYEQVIRNYSPAPGSITVEIRRSFGGDCTFVSQLDAKPHDYRTVQYRAQVAPGDTLRLRYEVTTRQGSNAKQNRLQVEPGDPTPVAWAD